MPPTTIGVDWKKWGAIAAIVGVAIVGAVYYVWTTQLTGTIHVIVRAADGSRSINTFSLSSKSLTILPDIDASLISGGASRTYRFPDGSAISLAPAGVVLADSDENVSVLIASPVSPTLQTPLAIWNEGARIAWVSPADQSLQVFERSARGTYLPIYLGTSDKVGSLGFTEDGTVLVIATVDVEKGGGSITELSAVDLSTPTKSSRFVASIIGFASIISL
jgi:hypothetical protein